MKALTSVPGLRHQGASRRYTTTSAVAYAPHVRYPHPRIHYTQLGMLKAELGHCIPLFHNVRRPRGAPFVPTPLFSSCCGRPTPHHWHAQRRTRPFLPPLHSVRRLLYGAPFMSTPLLVDDVSHSIPSMLRADFGLFAPLHSVRRRLGTPSVSTPLVDDVSYIPSLA